MQFAVKPMITTRVSSRMLPIMSLRPIIPLLFVFAVASHGAFAQQDDVYGQIAAQKITVHGREPMEVPGPAPVPQNLLPWNGGEPVKPIEKIDTPEKLAAALKDARDKFRPFFQEFTPPPPDVRMSIPIQRMQFRMETPEDRADFTWTLAGNGAWKDEAIPHYTGPGEQAVCWYRTVFNLPDAMKSKDRLIVHFNGVSYFAEVYVNGHYVGGHKGYFGAFDVDFTPYARKGYNVLLVKVRNSSRMGIGSSPTGETANRKKNIPRTFGDKIEASNSPGWDDPEFGWNGTPNGFGIYQGVSMETRSDSYLGDVFPRPNLADKSVDVAVEVENPSEANGAARLSVSLFGRNFQETVVPQGAKPIVFSLAGTRCIYHVRVPIPNSRTWTLDQPWLYTARVQLIGASGDLVDSMDKSFGMRSFELREDSEPHGRFYLNGQEIRLRGANEMGNFQLDVMRRDWNRLIDDVLLAKITRLNFIRCTQTVMPQEFYDCCDRLGLMTQSDLPLFALVSFKQAPEVLRQAVEMERTVRSHPSAVMISLMNEPDSGSGTGGKAFALNREQLEQLLDCARKLVRIENPDQAMKLIDGDYNPPSDGYPDNHCYSGWYGQHGVSLDRLQAGYWMKVRKDWMYGCGEFGVEGLDSIQTMEKYYPPAWLTAGTDGSWKPDRIPGSQTMGKFKLWYTEPRTMAEWVDASQSHQADVIKLKTEAFRRMTRMNSFAIHLLIDAWPAGWLKSIMDVDRQPKKAWYAYRDALAPIAVQVRSEKGQSEFSASAKPNVEIWVCNDTAATPDCELRYQVEQNGKVLQTGSATARVPTVTEGALCQGLLPLPLDIAAPADLQLRVSLVSSSDGGLIDQYLFAYRVKVLNPPPQNKGPSQP